MENNKICSDCGTVNEVNSRYCINCGLQLTQNNSVVIEQKNVQQNINTNTIANNQINNNDSEGTKLGIISLVLYFAGSAIFSFIVYFLPTSFSNYFSSLSGLFPLSGIIVMIVGRIKYPTNKLLKIVMWIIISSIILGIIAFVLFFIWCYVTCASMDTRGCD